MVDEISIKHHILLILVKSRLIVQFLYHHNTNGLHRKIQFLKKFNKKLSRLGKRELVFLLLITHNFDVFVPWSPRCYLWSLSDTCSGFMKFDLDLIQSKNGSLQNIPCIHESSC